MAKKKVTIELFKARDDAGAEPYEMMAEIIKRHHPHLEKARIAMAWAKSWKANADSQIVLGKCKKGAELERQMHGFDFVIILNQFMWKKWTELPNQAIAQKVKRALIDHELCHAEVARDGDDNVKKDEHGRIVYRIRKHDLEEFKCIIESPRHLERRHRRVREEHHREVPRAAAQRFLRGGGDVEGKYLIGRTDGLSGG